MASKRYNLLLIAVLGSLLLLCMVPQPSFAQRKPQKLDFYMLIVVQNLTRTSFPGAYTAVRTAAPAVVQNVTSFGVLNTFDNQLSKTPYFNNSADLVGRAQGWYGDCGQEELTLCLTQTFTYDDGTFKGTFSLVGVDIATAPLKEAAIVGGTGDFAFCRGVASQALLSNVSINLEEHAVFTYSVEFRF